MVSWQTWTTTDKIILLPGDHWIRYGSIEAIRPERLPGQDRTVVHLASGSVLSIPAAVDDVIDAIRKTIAPQEGQ